MSKRRVASATLIALLLLLVGVALCSKRFRPTLVGNRVPATLALRDLREAPAAIRSLRPRYPYSVIPGGVYSRAELLDRLAHDPTAREHYKGFDAHSVRLVQTADARLMYASYRVHDRILWTNRTLKIPKGELLLTDGVNVARARCGNRLSEIQPSTNVADEPPMLALAAPPLIDADAPALPGAFESPVTELPDSLLAIPAAAKYEAPAGPTAALGSATPALWASTPGLPLGFDTAVPSTSPGSKGNKTVGSQPGPPSSESTPDTLNGGHPIQHVTPIPEPGQLAGMALIVGALIYLAARFSSRKLFDVE